MTGNVFGNDWTYSRKYFGNVLENDWKCPRICARICPRHVAVETPKTSAPELVDNMRPRKPLTRLLRATNALITRRTAASRPRKNKGGNPRHLAAHRAPPGPAALRPPRIHPASLALATSVLPAAPRFLQPRRHLVVPPRQGPPPPLQ